MVDNNFSCHYFQHYFFSFFPPRSSSTSHLGRVVKSKTYFTESFGHFGAPWWIFQSVWCCSWWTCGTGAARLVPFCSDFKLMKNWSKRKVTFGTPFIFSRKIWVNMWRNSILKVAYYINTQIIYSQCLQSDPSFFQFHHPQSQNKLLIKVVNNQTKNQKQRIICLS